MWQGSATLPLLCGLRVLCGLEVLCMLAGVSLLSPREEAMKSVRPWALCTGTVQPVSPLGACGWQVSLREGGCRRILLLELVAPDIWRWRGWG